METIIEMLVERCVEQAAKRWREGCRKSCATEGGRKDCGEDCRAEREVQNAAERTTGRVVERVGGLWIRSESGLMIPCEQHMESDVISGRAVHARCQYPAVGRAALETPIHRGAFTMCLIAYHHPRHECASQDWARHVCRAFFVFAKAKATEPHRESRPLCQAGRCHAAMQDPFDNKAFMVVAIKSIEKGTRTVLRYPLKELALLAGHDAEAEASQTQGLADESKDAKEVDGGNKSESTTDLLSPIVPMLFPNTSACSSLFTLAAKDYVFIINFVNVHAVSPDKNGTDPFIFVLGLQQLEECDLWSRSIAQYKMLLQQFTLTCMREDLRCGLSPCAPRRWFDPMAACH